MLSAAHDDSLVTRSLQDCTFLEACIENNSKTALFLDRVNFEPSPAWQASKVEGEGEGEGEEERVGEREGSGAWLEGEGEEVLRSRGPSETGGDESQESKAVREAVR